MYTKNLIYTNLFTEIHKSNIMKIKLFFLFLIPIILISCQNENQEIKIIPHGYYVRELKSKPILFNVINKKDTIQLFTDFKEFDLNPNMIEAIDVIKDKRVEENFMGYERYGVISIHIKDEYWSEVISITKTVTNLSLEEVRKKDNDTVYLGEKTLDRSMNSSNLIVRTNNRYYKKCHLGFLDVKNNMVVPVDSIIKIDKNKIKVLSESNLKITNHLKPTYQLIYDLDLDRIIWEIKSTKANENGGLNTYGGKSYSNEKGEHTLETLEIDAISGKILTSSINENVVIKIK